MRGETTKDTVSQTSVRGKGPRQRDSTKNCSGRGGDTQGVWWLERGPWEAPAGCWEVGSAGGAGKIGPLQSGRD